MNLNQCPVCYPSTVFREQDTYESYEHSLKHLLKEDWGKHWNYITCDELNLTKERWN